MTGILAISNGTAGVALAAVLNSLWQALAVALAVWVALKCTPRINAATRYAVWWAVLAVVLALPVAPLLTARWQSRPVPVATEELPAPSRVALPVTDHTAVMSSAPHTRGPLLPFELRGGAWLWSILAVWCAVCMVRLGQLGWSYAYLRRVKRSARPATREQRLNFDTWLMTCRIDRPVRLLLSTDIASPMAVGFLRPAVILPEPLLDELTEQDLDHVLLHELAHIARRDDWTNLAAHLAAAAMALHPVATWVLRRIEREREIACDDWVVAVTGTARPYAESLARVFELCWERRRELLAAGIAGRGSRLRERIEMLLHSGRDFAPRASLARVVLSVILLLGLATAGAQAPRWVAFAQEPVAAALAEPPQATTPAQPVAAPAPLAPPQAATTPRPAAAPVAAPAAVPAAAAAPQVATASKGSFLAALVAAGYGGLSVDEIIELRVNGVSAEFLAGINESGWGKLTPKQLVELSIHGVKPEYVRKMREAGFRDLTLQEVIELRIHGVRPEQVQEIHALGFGPYTAKQSIEFAIHSARPDLFRALKDAGFAQADPREIIEARIHGLRSENLREAKTYGSSLTLKQIIKLKQAGVI